MGKLFILILIYVLQVFFTVLHPRHKLQYFEKAGGEEIKTSRNIVRTKFNQTYAFMDVEEQSNTPPPPSVCNILFILFTLMLKLLLFSVLLPLTTFSMICQHFPPLLNLISAMNSIVTSALLSMLLMQSLGGMRNELFILASIAWHWITSLFLVSYLFFKFFSKDI